MKIRADLHTHTVASGHAYSTVEEIARAARKKGLKIVAITDHGPKMPDGPHNYYFYNLRALPEKMHGVRILKGVEANIISKNGQLDIDTALLASYEVVIASVHVIASPENLSKSIMIEAAELLENFQWSPEFDKEKVTDELADILIYCVLMADTLGVDIETIMNDKIDKNEKKYPVEKAKGNSKKYTEY